MKKIIEYTTTETNQVQSQINKGWQPYGSPFFNRTYNCEMQAMVKYEEIFIGTGTKPQGETIC